jgi:hypothetical protein
LVVVVISIVILVLCRVMLWSDLAPYLCSESEEGWGRQHVFKALVAL